MAEKRDYYEVLGISKNATEQDIKSAFRKLSRKYHPDMQSGKSDSEKKEAEEKFKEAAEAYKVLSNEDKRASYDQFGFNGSNMHSGSPFSAFDMADFLHKHMHMFGHRFNPFGFDDEDDRFNEASVPDFNLPEDGQNVQLAVELAFKEAVNGCEKSFDLKLTKPCTECNGTGIEKNTSPEKCNRCKGKGKIIETMQSGFMISQTITDCPECHGAGFKVKHCHKCNGAKREQDIKHITVKVPAGIDEGQRLRVVGKGHCGVKGGRDGNLFIVVHIKHQDIFERHGINVKTKIQVDPITATLGGKVKAASPYGMIDVSIPSGIKSGKQIVVNGKGIKTSNAAGNLVVEVEISPFANINDEQKKMLDDLRSTLNKSNFPFNDDYADAAKALF